MLAERRNSRASRGLPRKIGRGEIEKREEKGGKKEEKGRGFWELRRETQARGVSFSRIGG